jgi:peroxiredoxin
MKHKIFLAFSLFAMIVGITFLAYADDPRKFEDFTLKDYSGKEHSLSDFKDSKAIVVMFIATQCPVSNDYNSRMAELYKEYSAKNIAFVGINSNKQESVSEIKSHAAKNNLDFVILKDEKNVIADVFKASFTPEIYVLSPDFSLLYHGRIDDSQRIDKVKTQDLKNVLDEILDGKPVSVKKTKAFGCTIKRV